MRTAVVLGSGHVAGPAIRTILDSGARVVVATDQPGAARALLGGHPHGEVAEVDAGDAASLRAACRRGQVVVSLLPAALHPRVAEACLAERRALVTTSYVSEDMRALDGLARRRDLLFLNEVGADPGIDHMQAARLMARVRAEGGHVTAFRSLCGGLPAPDACDNPFKYKISWSPRGVALAGSRPARYLAGGELVPVPRLTIFDRFEIVEHAQLGPMEAVPNGDALRYLDAYGLEEVDGFLRGTLRWPGWCETWSALCRLGYVDDAPGPGLAGPTWEAELREAAGARESEATAAAIVRRAELPSDSAVPARLEWLGLAADEPLPPRAATRLDLLVTRMEERLRFRPGERDLLAMVHELEWVDAAGRPRRLRASWAETGIPNGDTAMARFVGWPAGFAARRILDGTIRETGVRIPVTPSLYEPLLADLAAAGLEERLESLPPRS